MPPSVPESVPYRAGNYLFFPRKGTDKYAAKLQKSVRVPKAFRLEPALAKIRRVFRVELEKAIKARAGYREIEAFRGQ